MGNALVIIKVFWRVRFSGFRAVKTFHPFSVRQHPGSKLTSNRNSNRDYQYWYTVIPYHLANWKSQTAVFATFDLLDFPLLDVFRVTVGVLLLKDESAPQLHVWPWERNRKIKIQVDLTELECDVWWPRFAYTTSTQIDGDCERDYYQVRKEEEIGAVNSPSVLGLTGRTTRYFYYSDQWSVLEVLEYHYWPVEWVRV